MFRSILIAALVLIAAPPPPAAGAPVEAADAGHLLPLTQLSPGLLGMFRKMMEIEDDIRTHAVRYDVPFDLARAVCLHESGGNRNLRSGAGAQGYFQVMPATFRSLRVKTNIEAGMKYLSQMMRQFGREDYAVAAYNAGPGRVRRGRPPLETLQYVLAVGHYRNVLKLHERSIRHHALQIGLETIREGDSWWSISQRVGVSVLQLRMHNPFLATRTLRTGQIMAYPPAPRTDLLVRTDDGLTYRTRHGDNYLHLAFVLEVDRNLFRDVNGLWRLQTLPPGQVLRIPLARPEKNRKGKQRRHEHPVAPEDDFETIAAQYGSTPWRVMRDNGLLLDEPLEPGAVLKVAAAAHAPVYRTHRVARGDTLTALARRYGISIRAIQTANRMGRRTGIRIGERLRIPSQVSG